MDGEGERERPEGAGSSASRGRTGSAADTVGARVNEQQLHVGRPEIARNIPWNPCIRRCEAAVARGESCIWAHAGVHRHGCLTDAAHARSTVGTDGSRTGVSARATGAIKPFWTTHCGAVAGATAAIGEARFTSAAAMARARGLAHPCDAHLVALAGQARARINATAHAADLVCRAGDAFAGFAARPAPADSSRRAGHRGARNVHARAAVRAHEPASAAEFLGAHLKADAALAHLSHGTEAVTVINRAVAVVVQSVASLHRWGGAAHARECPAPALANPLRADAWFAGVAAVAAARANEVIDDHEEVLEVVVSAVEEVFPGEIEGVGRRARVVDQ